MMTGFTQELLRVRPVQNGALIIGEVAQTHDGSLGVAHAFIDAIANAGADAVKFQTHIASAESTPGEPWRVKFSRQDSTRYDYWKRMEFTEEQWAGLKEHADECGILFLSSAFSVEAVDLLHRIGMQAWKVASGEINNPVLMDAMLATGAPMMISSGMSSYRELDIAVDSMRKASIGYAVMQCTSAYPCPPEKIGMNMLSEFKQRYDCSVGLSDHSGTIYPSLAAATVGVEVLEMHVTLSHEMFGPDVPVSITTRELRSLVEGVRFIESMNSNPVNKDEMAVEMEPLRGLFTKSIVARREISAGTVLTEDDLCVKKPGTGIPAEKLGDVLGKAVQRDYDVDELLHLEDLA